MSAVWVSIALLAVATAAIRAAGPLALGGRRMPPAFARLIRALPAALFVALVITLTFSKGTALAVDSRAAGVAAAGLAAWRGASMVTALVVAAAVAAAVRLIAG